MKKILLAFTTSAIALSSTFAQVLNPSFETWGLDTSVLDLSSLGLPKDTFSFQDPTQWTSSNALTGGKTLGFKNFVTQSTSPNTGSFAVKLKTDTILFPVLNSYVTIPGFVASGDFKINISSFTGGSFSPTNIPGAGIPVNGRKGSVTGYFKYAPVVPGADSCAAIAVLKKGSKVVATATFFSKAVTNSYTPFTANFVYTDCAIPDSVVILLCSSNPYTLQNLLNGGTSTLPVGTIAEFDDIALVDTAVNFSIPPIAVLDTTSTLKNTPKNISVLANDQSCYGGTLSATLPSSTSPHGSVSIASGVVTYTPTTGYIGKDTFFYTLASTGTAVTVPGMVALTVKQPSGINNINAIEAAIYPNPVQNTLNIEADAKIAVKAIVSDIIGHVVSTENIVSDNTAINTSSLQNGMYVVSLVDATGKTRFASKFVVSK